MEIKSLDNPRVEKEDHYYKVHYTGLLDLGLQPHYLTDEVLENIFAVIEKYKNRINKDSFFRGITWK